MENLQHLPAEILLGIVNEKLRLNCPDKDALYYELDLSPTQLEHKLSALGYEYHSPSNQYRRLK
ncbi:hypothetical protein TUM17387_24120 [Shewanella carassii]|uniref:DUF4250 domain-containing protein n=1 Tax=Shewanella carassii TaxID=1987584 RepID=UPI001BEEA856|nr:DUF4250 domain-containing protein [Shewanella carassii]BCV67053.1 hypothetical protein TUM17387_24120 [Shewanella carassii]